MIYVKLTNPNNTTHGGCHWNPGEWKETSGKGEMCGPGWLHCYRASSERIANFLAFALNPIHGNFENPISWVVEVGGVTQQDALKCAWTRMRLIRRAGSKPTTTQLVAFAILLIKEFYMEKSFLNWADGWLSGENRTASEAARAAAVEAAARAASEAAWAAVEAAREAAARTISGLKVEKCNFQEILENCARKAMEYE